MTLNTKIYLYTDFIVNLLPDIDAYTQNDHIIWKKWRLRIIMKKKFAYSQKFTDLEAYGYKRYFSQISENFRIAKLQYVHHRMQLKE